VQELLYLYVCWSESAEEFKKYGEYVVGLGVALLKW